MPELATVRRFEAAGFRAWPASSTHYDGTWLVRLNAGHPAKRLNSVNPLDPGDFMNIVERIARAERRFEAYARPVTFRVSPLAGDKLVRHLDQEGWSRFSESIVMRCSLSDQLFDDALDQIPLKDVARFTGAAIPVHGLDPALRPGLSEIISSIEPEAGLFVLDGGDNPVSTAICVHDGDLAGLFEIATRDGERGRGFGRRIVRSALKWAAQRGAKHGWLQVEADNAAALALYRSMGFTEAYRYHYRRPPGS